MAVQAIHQRTAAGEVALGPSAALHAVRAVPPALCMLRRRLVRALLLTQHNEVRAGHLHGFFSRVFSWY